MSQFTRAQSPTSHETQEWDINNRLKFSEKLIVDKITFDACFGRSSCCDMLVYLQFLHTGIYPLTLNKWCALWKCLLNSLILVLFEFWVTNFGGLQEWINRKYLFLSFWNNLKSSSSFFGMLFANTKNSLWF